MKKVILNPTYSSPSLERLIGGNKFTIVEGEFIKELHSLVLIGIHRGAAYCMGGDHLESDDINKYFYVLRSTNDKHFLNSRILCHKNNFDPLFIEENKMKTKVVTSADTGYVIPLAGPQVFYNLITNRAHLIVSSDGKIASDEYTYNVAHDVWYITEPLSFDTEVEICNSDKNDELNTKKEIKNKCLITTIIGSKGPVGFFKNDKFYIDRGWKISLDEILFNIERGVWKFKSKQRATITIEKRRVGHVVSDYITDAKIFNKTIGLGKPIEIPVDYKQYKLLNSNFVYISNRYKVDRPAEIRKVTQILLDTGKTTPDTVDTFVVTDTLEFKRTLRSCVFLDTIFLSENLTTDHIKSIRNWARQYHPACLLSSIE